jgi:chromosome segregation ATPase
MKDQYTYTESLKEMLDETIKKLSEEEKYGTELKIKLEKYTDSIKKQSDRIEYLTKKIKEKEDNLNRHHVTENK